MTEDPASIKLDPCFRIHTEYTEQEVDGFDSIAMHMPDGVYVEVDGERRLHAVLLGRMLREVSEASAANLGRKLQRAEWTITKDIDLITKVVRLHDCALCTANADQAVAWVKDKDEEILIGICYWADE